MEFCKDCQSPFICGKRGCLDDIAAQVRQEAQGIADRGGFHAAGMARLIEELEAGPRLSEATLEEISEEVNRRKAALDEWAKAAPFAVQLDAISEEEAEWMNAPMGPIEDDDTDRESAAIWAVIDMLAAQGVSANEMIARLVTPLEGGEYEVDFTIEDIDNYQSPGMA